MALYADRVKDTTTSTGTAAIVLNNTQLTGYRSFANAFGSSTQPVGYCIADSATGDWEVGVGTFNGTTGLTRTTVLSSSAAGSPVNFVDGTKEVFCTAPAQYLQPVGLGTSTTGSIQYKSSGGTFTGDNSFAYENYYSGGYYYKNLYIDNTSTTYPNTLTAILLSNNKNGVVNDLELYAGYYYGEVHSHTLPLKLSSVSYNEAIGPNILIGCNGSYEFNYSNPLPATGSSGPDIKLVGGGEKLTSKGGTIWIIGGDGQPGGDVNIDPGCYSTFFGQFNQTFGHGTVSIGHDTIKVTRETVLGDTFINTNKLGFFGATPVKKPAATASGTGGVLSSIVQGLGDLGLIDTTNLTDITTGSGGSGTGTVTIGGSDTHLQYNSGGALAGSSALSYNYNTSSLSLNPSKIGFFGATPITKPAPTASNTQGVVDGLVEALNTLGLLNRTNLSGYYYGGIQSVTPSATGNVQYDLDGVLTGNTSFAYTPGSNTLTIPNIVATTAITTENILAPTATGVINLTSNTGGYAAYIGTSGAYLRRDSTGAVIGVDGLGPKLINSTYASAKTRASDYGLIVEDITSSYGSINLLPAYSESGISTISETIATQLDLTCHNVTSISVGAVLSGDTVTWLPKLGFFGSTPVAKPTPTATGTGSVLSAVVTSLSNLGLLNSTGLTDFTATPTLSVAGSTGQIQFNSAGVLGAASTSTNFTFTNANSLLTLGSMLVTGTGSGNLSNTISGIGIASINSTATAGAQRITVRGGNPSFDLADGGFPGGDVRILGGTRTGDRCKGGSVQIYAGDSGSADGTNFNQATVSIRSGYYYDAGTNSSRAEIYLDEGINNSTEDGDGGGSPATALAQVSSINLTPGYNFYGQATPGNVNIYLPKDGADNNSRFRVYSGSTYAGGTLALEVSSAIGPNSIPTIGFFGVTPVFRPNASGSGIGNAVSNIVTSLSNLGLISSSLTNISANFTSTVAGLVPASGSTSSGLFLNAGGTFTTPSGGTTYSTFTSSAAGLVPASGGDTSNFLRADGTFAAPPVFSGYDNEIHVSQVDGNNTTGNGDLLTPVASITKALTLITGERRTIIVHPGTYTESPSITVQYTALTGPGAIGGNVLISGTLSTSVGCTISGLKMTNLTITAPASTGNVNVLNCDISGTLTKSSSADYTLIRFCDIGITNITSSAGLVAIFGGNPNFITINNAGARVIVKNAVTVAPVLTAGNANFVDSIVVASSATSNALTTAAGTIVTLANSQFIVPTFNGVARVSLSGFYSIFNCVYDKPNSTLAALSATGGSTNSIDYFQYINADRLILSLGGQITFPDSTVQTTAFTGPAGSNTQIQFNNAGAFAGSADFTYTSGTNTLTTGNITGSDTTSMVIQSKAPASGSSPTLTIQTPNSPSASFTPGNLTLRAGSRGGVGTGAGASVNIIAGRGGAVGGGGSINLTSGLGEIGSSPSGNINLTTPYDGTVSLSAGYVNMSGGSANISVNQDEGSGSYLNVNADTIGFFSATPVAQPAPTASGTGNVLSSVVTALNSLGLVSSAALTNASTLTAAGATTQIQFNNAGAFGGSANFTYTSGTNTLTTGNITGSALAMTIKPKVPTGSEVPGTLAFIANSGLVSTTGGAAGSISFTAGTAGGTTAGNVPGTGAAGSLTFSAGDANTINVGGFISSVTGGGVTFNAGQGRYGGDLNFNAGIGRPNLTTNLGTGKGGNLNFKAGNGIYTQYSGVSGGDVNFTTGYGTNTGSSGNLNFTVGDAENGPCGNINIIGGSNYTGASGKINITTAFGAQGDIKLETIGANTDGAYAGNIVLTCGPAGDPEGGYTATSSTGGSFIFTGGEGLGGGSIGGSFKVTTGSGTTDGVIDLKTSRAGSVLKITSTENGNLNQLGFFGSTPIGKPAPTANSAINVLVEVVTALNSYGLIDATSLTNVGSIGAAGSTNQIQFNSSGLLGTASTSTNFTFSDATSLLTLGNLRVTGSTGTIAAPNATGGTAGQSITIQAANQATGVVGGIYNTGGSLTLKSGGLVSGSSTVGRGGDITIQAGHSGSAGGTNFSNTTVSIQSGGYAPAASANTRSSITLDGGKDNSYYSGEDFVPATQYVKASGIILNSGYSSISTVAAGDVNVVLGGWSHDAGSFIVSSRLAVNSISIEATSSTTGVPQLGFFGATPTTKATITGSRSTQTVQVLADLLTALNNLGLITNSTTA